MPRKRAPFFTGEHLDLSKRVGILGASMSGKTRGMYQLLHMAHTRNKDKFGRGIEVAFGFSNSENGNGNLGGPIKNNQGKVLSKFSLMPAMFARHGFDKERLAEIMEYQMKTKKVGRGKECMIIFDDVFNERGMNRCAEMDKLAQNGRNGQMGMFVSVHKMKQLGTGVRSSLHFIVVYDLQESEAESFRLEFASELFDSKKELWEFWKALRQRRGKYWAMVIDIKNAAGSAAFEDRVAVFKSKDPAAPDYRVPHFCEQGFWWLQTHLVDKASGQVDMAELFDFGRIAAERRIDIGTANRATIEKLHQEHERRRRRETLLAPSVLNGLSVAGGGNLADRALELDLG